MDQTQARQMRDQHGRDEAELRRSQQLSAGDQFSPVESSPQHGASPLSDGGSEATAVDDYEIALSTERSAWERLQSLSHWSNATAEWLDWRSAVEARDLATRLLINHFLEEMARTQAQAGGA